MKTYYLVCRKNTDNVNSKMIRTKTNLNVQFVEIKKVNL